jgi:hypothetical protein
MLLLRSKNPHTDDDHIPMMNPHTDDDHIPMMNTFVQSSSNLGASAQAD